MSFSISDQYEVEMKLGRPTSEFSDFSIDRDIGERRLGLSAGNVKTFFITESIHQLVPTVTIQYKSPAPVFQEHYPVIAMEPFILTMGKVKKEENIFSEHYYFSSTKPDDTEAGGLGQNQNVVLKGHHFPIKFLLSGQKASFSGRISDVVREVTDQVDADFDSFIDPTHSQQKGNWVQPGWSNAKFLNYLTKKAVSNANNFSDYFLFFRPDDKFYFKNLDSLFSQDRKDDPISRFEFDLSTSGEQNNVMQKEKRKSRGDPNNQKQSNKIRRFGFENAGMSGLDSGLLGHKTSGFSWNNGEYESDQRSLLEYPFHQPLTTRAFYNQNRLLDGDFSTGKENSYVGNTDFSGEVEGKLKEQIMKENRDVSRLTILTGDNTPLSAGDIARVDIYDSGVSGNRQDVLSGEWLVENRVRFIYGRGEYTQVYKLIRTGINEPDSGEMNDSINERFGQLKGGSEVNVRSDFGLGSGGVIS
jgi:hypothetical protein